MSNEQNIHLVQRLQDDSPGAFDELYLKYYTLLCGSAYFILQNKSEAKDIVQSFFLEMLEKKLYLAFSGDIKGYLFVSIKNRCLNRLKSERAEAARRNSYNSLQDIHQPAVAEEEGRLGYHRQLESLLTSIKGQKKAALEMVYLHDKKYKEAAGEMGISINSFKTHLKGALKVLRANAEFNKKINPF